MRHSRYLIASFVLLASAWLILLNAQNSGLTLNAWSTGSSLSAARSGACSVTMADGRVMFAGGTGASGVVNTVDILGTNGAFTAGAPMLTSRAGAACALLQDGRIFVSGGNDGINALADAEFFTPSTGVWTSAGAMHTARYGHTASVTEMGAVLLMGGKTNNGVTSQLEVFRPANNSFTVLGSLSTPRTGYAVVMVDNHRTLIAGGSDGKHTLNSIDVFDSYTNAITPAGAMLAARSNFGAAKLIDGTVMFTGGFDTNGAPLASTEIFNADKQASVAGPNLNIARGSHQTFALPGNGGVMVFGGSDGQNSLSSSEIYQPWTGKFTNATPMNSARSGAATSLMAGGIVAAGGRNGGGYLSGAESYLFSTIQTDKADYQPGNTATFAGGGWKPGETVNVTVTAMSATPTTEFTGTAVADGNGRISISSFNIAPKHFGMKFLLDAKGSQSEAQTTFTDADVTQILVGIQGGVYGSGIPTPCAVAPPNCTEPYGQAFGFPFKVADVTTPANAPVGNVILYDNNITISAANLSITFNNPQAAAPYPVGTPLPDTGNITANINDQTGIDSPGFNAFTLQYVSTQTVNFENSTTASITVQVSPVSTQTVIQNPMPTTPIAYGAQATLSATVTTLTTVIPNNLQYSMPPEGTLIFNDGNPADACTGVRTPGPQLGQSTYSCQTPVTLSQGTHNYGASYQGITNIWLLSSSNATVPVSVVAVGTTTAITTSAGTPSVFPTPMTITATVTQAAGPGPATGQVNFYDGSNDLCGVAYTLGGNPSTVTSCKFILAGGAHMLNAVYTPDSTNFLTSTSGSTSFTITPQPTTTAVTGGGSFNLGGNVTMTATVSCSGTNAIDCGTTVPTVSGVGAAVPSPAGTISFFDSNNGDVQLNGAGISVTPTGSGTSSASFSTTTLAAGTHNIVAVFTPGTATALDWSASDSTATPVAFIVGPTAPTFNIQIAPASPTAYQALTFTVSAIPSGGQTPTGSVVLTVGGPSGFTTSSQVLNNGSASFNTSGTAYGNHTLAVAYTKAAAEVNFSSTPSATVNPTSFNVGSTGTTTTVTSSLPSPIQFGSNATFTATVAASTAVAAGSPAPTGTVSFVLGAATNLCTNVALNVSGTAQCTPATLIPANTNAQSITATYTPTPADSDYLGSSGTFSMQVNPATTTTTISASTNPINLLGSVTYTVSVSAPQSAGNPTGTVSLTDNGNALSPNPTAGCPASLSAANPATECFFVTYTGSGNLAGGTHSIVATFGGSQNFGTSSSAALTETVNPFLPTIGTPTVMSGASTVTTAPYYNGGTQLTLNFTYSFGANPPSPTPTQMFQIFDSGTLLGTLAVPASGTATSFNLPLTLGVGSHTFFVKYPTGDANYSAATSTGAAFAITKFTDSLTPTSFTTGTPASPNLYGTAVTVGGTVSNAGASNPPPAAPTGTLTFTFGAVTLGTCQLSGGACSLGVTNAALTVPAVQPDTVNIAYNGDANYASATGSGTLYVGQNTVTGSINTSPSGSAAFGVPVTVSVTFGPAGPGSVGTPSGTATIYDALGAAAPVSIGTVPLNGSGIATLTTSSLSPGSHTLSASYNGDTNFKTLAQGSGPSVGLTVNTGNTSVSLAPSANPVSLNQTVTYNFSVSGGPTAPAGTVTLTDSITGAPTALVCNGGVGSTITLVPPASGNVTSGSCSITYGSAVPNTPTGSGSHTIVATYTSSNTATWSSATSAVLTENVGQIAPVISQPVTSPAQPITYGTSVTYSINLTPANPSPAYGPNTVQFYDNGVALGSPLSVTTIGTSTFTTPAQTPVGGQHTITAQFLGDTNYAPSLLSPKLVYTVGKGTPTVTTAFPLSMTVPYWSMIGNATYPLPQITVAGTGGVKPTGSVSLMAGTTVLATGTLDANGQITFTNIQLPASLVVPNSPFSFFVQYGGDNNWAAAQSTPATLTLTKAPDNVTVTSSSANPVFGQSITLTATFAPVGNPASGNIDFLSNNGSSPNPVCAAAIIANGVATCTTSSLALGANTITVSNLQNEPNHTLAGAVVTTTTVNVGTATTSTALVSSLNPSSPGVAVSFTATVTVLPPGNPTGTLKGTVTFTWTQNSQQSNPLAACAGLPLSSANSGASVTCMVPANSVPFSNAGQYLITATYSPAVNETNTTSAATITQNVGKPAPTFTSILTPTNPAVFGQSVTITATFTVPGSTPPTGMVQFYDGSNTLGGTQTIAGTGPYTAQITVPSGAIPTFTVGNHSISAVYIPGVADNYGSDNSATQNPPVILSLVVGQGGTASGATNIQPGPEVFATQGIPNAPVYGEQIQFSAIITPVAPATGCPTGFATFSDAGTQIGPTIQVIPTSPCTNQSSVTITTSSLNAAGPVPNLGVGNHGNIIVHYLGDTNFSSSSSTSFPAVNISPAPTITMLSAIPAAAQKYGAEFSLNAKVCAENVNGGPSLLNTCESTPFPGFKGLMMFYDGTTLLNPGGVGVLVDPFQGTAGITITLAAPPLQAAAAGTHNITAQYIAVTAAVPPVTIDPDFAGSASAPQQLQVSQGPTTTTVSSNVNPSVYGQPVIFTAIVAAPSSFGALPTGSVTFVDGALPLGTVALANVSGSAQAQFTVPNAINSALAVGANTISVQYSGDVNYAASTTAPLPCSATVTQGCSISQVVNQAATSLTLTSSANGSTTGQQVTLTATIAVIAPGAPVLAGANAGPTGSVTFYTNYVSASNPGTSLGTGVVTHVQGTVYAAVLTLNSLTISAGNGQAQVPVTAVYSGDLDYSGSMGALTQNVSKVQSSVSVTSSQNNTPVGTPVTYTISVSAINPGSGTPAPTGAVTLFDGSNVLATPALSQSCGSAGDPCSSGSFTTALPVGGHILSAAYTGDLNYQAGSGSQLSAMVYKIVSTLNLTSSVPAGAVASQVITFTAQIQPNPPVGVPYATGQIGFFMDGATQIGAASLASGVATLSTTLPAGNHQIQAFYVGDANWSSAQSIYLAQVVGTATTTTQIVSSSNPSVFGQPVVMTITVAVPYPGTVPATGTVQLYDGGNAIGNPLSANNGTFSTTLSNLSVGTHSISAQFQTNGSFSQSTSASLSQIVNKAPTATTLAAMPNSTTSNQGITLTAVVTVPATWPLNVAPTGTVQFADVTTSQVLGSAPLNSVGGVWVATLNTSALTAGSQTQLLTATYSGDGNFATSTSPAVNQSVYTTQISVVNAAGYTGTNFAPNSFVAIFGSNLAYTTATALVTPLPSSLSGSTVTVTDSNGVARLAPMYYASLPQINCIIPANTAYGLATVTVTNASGEAASTTVLISPTSPGLYSENASGMGVAAGFVLAQHADGTQSTQQPLFQLNPNTQQYVGVPIAWTSSTDQEYLVLYGTGIRGAAQNNVTATIKGVSIPVIYAGAQSQFAGEDQVNLGPIPTSLKGAGTVNVIITANGQASNTVTVTIQ